MKEQICAKTRSDFYLIAFESANHAIQAEKKARDLFEVTMIPTPREISSGCGFSLRFSGIDQQKYQTFYKQQSVPCRLYHLSEKRKDGTRAVAEL